MAFDNQKTFSRNEQIKLTAKFFEEEEELTPIIPISSSYPSFIIRNPKNDIVYSGTAIDYSTQGNYQVTWTIPKDAMLSSDEDSWTIEWIMVASDGRQIQYKENFLVVDMAIETNEDHSIIQVVQANKTFRLYNYFEVNPIEISLDIYTASNSSEPLMSFTKEDLTFVTNERGHIGYYVDVPEGLNQGEYLSFWSYRYTELSDVSREFKSLRSVKPTILRLADQLRVLIDRYNKRQSAPNAYSDSDLIEFLDKGLEMVNAWYPVSNPAIVWDSVDSSPYKIYIIACAAIWGLKSQYLLETDLAFNFSGLTTSIDYDRTGAIDSFLSSLIEWVNNNLSKAKIATTRSYGIGSVAVRPYSIYNNARNRVIAISGPHAGENCNVYDLLVLLGL